VLPSKDAKQHSIKVLYRNEIKKEIKKRRSGEQKRMLLRRHKQTQFASHAQRHKYVQTHQIRVVSTQLAAVNIY